MADQLALFIDFENVAIWADEHFFDLDLTRLMEYLQSRGPVVIKRAYGDWRRFGKYRNDMLNNAIDLIQLYSYNSLGTVWLDSMNMQYGAPIKITGIIIK